jgi:replicative DNA helicase
MFRGAAKTAWRFVDEYERSHEEVPGIGLVCENSGLAVGEPEDDEDEKVSISYVADKLYERYRFWCLQHGTNKVVEHLDDGEYDEAEGEVHKLSEHLRTLTKGQSQLYTLADIAPEVLALYERTKSGEIGVPFPWDAMNEMTLGLWPQTLTFFVARPGVGKTWTAIIIALHAWAMGKKVLVVSPEMSRVELGERVVAKYGKIAYGDLVSANLGNGVGGRGGEHHLRAVIKDLETKTENFYVLDDEERLEPKFIEQAIDAIEPDLVIVDSVYMMRVEEGKVKSGAGSKGSRYDRIHETVDWLRRMSRIKKVPVIGVSQLNRDGKVKKADLRHMKAGKGTGGLENTLAMTDTLLWDVHNLFAVWQDDDMRTDNQLMFVPLKARRRARACHVVIRWDMTTMDFEQIGTQVISSKGDSDFKDDDYDSPF